MTDAFIPSKKAFVNTQEQTYETSSNFGISSMAVEVDDLESEHHVRITRSGISIEGEFKFEPVTKKAPTGLWGEPRLTKKGKLELPDVNATQYIDNVLSGFCITPVPEAKPCDTKDIPIARLQYDTDQISSAYSWETLEAFAGILTGDDHDQERREKIKTTVETNSQRDSILQALGFDLSQAVDINAAAIADAFIFAPRVK
ncbi:hypothetical protein I8748_25825 [Nostoc sp. CENA67]|uniref:Uncharacterized protein n=1 Tax=Amazonocrinis nigriterrae CENA67 TaxID=2794033 RepID=A0A8J7LD88_9NOST|nr:hypothetical protein [Amazonocrinis nigriterrae]MBH8565551.1 hypothetical protein [Amazonocrinis nigriterrae CENA67]